MNVVAGRVKHIWRHYVPERLRARVNASRAERREAAWRKPRKLGDLRRTTPFGTWGESRDGPIDRFYVGQFIAHHAEDIRGRVLEIAGDEYTRWHGQDVRRVDILDIKKDNPRATFVADLADAPSSGQHLRLRARDAAVAVHL